MDSRTYLWLGYTVIAVVAFMTLFSAMNKLASTESFNEKNLASDLALFGQVVFASPNDVSFSYELNKNYDVLFEEPCSFRVSKIGTSIYSGGFFLCPGNSLDLNYPESTFEVEKVSISKEGDVGNVS